MGHRPTDAPPFAYRTKLSDDDEQADETTMTYCPECGWFNRPENKQCSRCGYDIRPKPEPPREEIGGGSAPCRNSEYALKIVADRRLAGGGHGLNEASYAALTVAPEEMHAIVNYYRGGAGTAREDDVTTTLRAFVARRRLGEAVTFRQVRSQREAQNEKLSD